MVEVNTSLYPQPAQASAAPNLLQTAQQGMQLYQSINNVRAFEEKFAAQRAMAEMAQGSIDPATGEMDWNKFATKISTSPLTAITAPEVLGQIAQRKLTDATTLGKTLENEKARLEIIGKVASGLYALGPNVKSQDLINALGEPSLQRAVGGPEAATRILRSAPAGGPALQQWLLQHMMMANTADGNLSKVLPQFKELTGGGGVTPYGTVDQLTGKFTQQGSVVQQPTVSERNAPITYKDANGREVTAPAAARPGGMQTGGGGIAPGTGGENPITQHIPGSTSPLGEQVTGGTVENIPPGQLRSTPETRAQAVPFGTPQVKDFSPQEKRYRTDVGKNFAEYEDNLNTTVRGTADAMQLINESREALKAVQTGGGASAFAKLAQVAQAVGAKQQVVDRIAGGDLSAAQEFQKLAVQQATLIMTNLLKGGGRFTNLEFQKFQDNNPNLDMDPRAIEKIWGFLERIGKLKFNEQRALAQYKELPNADVTKFPEWWNSQLRKAGVLGENAK